MFICAALCALCVCRDASAQDDAPAFSLAEPDENAAPEPDNAEPQNGSVHFSWKPVKGAEGYRVQVGRSLLFSPAVLDVTVRDAQLIQPVTSLPKSLCYWRVSVVRGDGSEGPFSGARVLNLRAERQRKIVSSTPVDDEAPPPVMQPADGEHIAFGGGKTAKVPFRWAGFLSRVRIQISDDNTFRYIVHTSVLRKKGATVKLPVGDFCWRMSHTAGPPRWSEPQCFSVVTDTEPPVLTIASPGPQLFTPHTLVTIQGATEPGAKVTINRARIRLRQRGEFKMLMPLSRGKNVFTLTAKDAYGNAASREIVVMVVPREVYVRVFVRVKRLQQNIQQVEALRAELDAQNQELQKLMIGSPKASEELANELLSVEKENHELKIVRQQLEAEVTLAARSLESAAAEIARVR